MTEAIDEIRRETGYLSGVLSPAGIRWEVKPMPSAEWHDHVLCPVEKMGRLEAMARSLGYECTGPLVGSIHQS